MKFEIAFNDPRMINSTTNKILENLGAKFEYDKDQTKEFPDNAYYIELNSFEELKELLKKVDKETKDTSSAIISFDPPTIFLDNEV